jgi:dTDP-4-amino-4,6-dideoxygalactose transaminase
MTGIHAASGLSQMHRLNELISKRHLIAARYNQMFDDLPVFNSFQHTDAYSSCHSYAIPLTLHAMGGIYNEVYGAPVLSAVYCREAEKYFSAVISIPVYSGLKDVEQNRLLQTFIQFLSL